MYLSALKISMQMTYSLTRQTTVDQKIRRMA